MTQRNGDKRDRRKDTELQRDESSLESDGFTYEARGQQLAALESSNSSIGHERF